ncbi:hypothetical protein BIZ83_gp243 [Erwinia phage vB_EamM_ChrisDB]|uniref:hypothetical protein n=1 Tax=Erwinia phage vB_EamM_ChrisDB TaxID=1883371 RepID=UPI00081C34E7|nr:hypothetical protein BIZ83_gp243 [Erwinia phage vB_EamM_ChrisDB]ANZ48610.1 hypothetical protein CHRISDB_48 [Erwinia phage vB_EamM_ChrisDB]
MHIIAFYQSELESLGFNRDGDLLVHADDGTPAYFTYNKEKRRLVLPTSAMIKNGMEDPQGRECHAFHPLCESVLAGESGTIRFLKKAIRANVWLRTMDLIDVIMDINASGKSVRAAAYKKFMTEIICEGIKEPKLDEKLKSSWVALSNHLTETVEPKKQSNLYIASDLSIDGTKYVRVANFKHLFEEESLDDTATYFGVKMHRKQDKVIIHRLLMTIMGWYPDLCGSNDNRPYFGCLSRGWAQYVINYNQIVKGLRDVSGLKTLSDEWIGQLDSLSQYDNVIQTLPFNTGSASTNPEKDTTQQQYRVSSSQTSLQTERRMASETAQPAEEEGSLGSFFKKHLGNTDRSGKLDINSLPLVQQRALKESGQLIKKDDSPSVTEISLVSVHGGRKAAPSLGSLNSSNYGDNSLLGGGSQQRLGGIGNLGGGSLLDSGPSLGPMSGNQNTRGSGGGFAW